MSFSHVTPLSSPFGNWVRGLRIPRFNFFFTWVSFVLDTKHTVACSEFGFYKAHPICHPFAFHFQLPFQTVSRPFSHPESQSFFVDLHRWYFSFSDLKNLLLFSHWKSDSPEFAFPCISFLTGWSRSFFLTHSVDIILFFKILALMGVWVHLCVPWVRCMYACVCMHIFVCLCSFDRLASKCLVFRLQHSVCICR